MAKKADGQNIYPANINFFADKCRNIAQAGLNMELKSENPQGNGVWFRIHHGMSFASYGEKITITLTPQGNSTHIHILSECGMPTQLVDYGKNKSNVTLLFQYLEQGMPIGAPQPAPAAPQAKVQPDPAVVFCTSCGQKNDAAANFCKGCGAPLR